MRFFIGGRVGWLMGLEPILLGPLGSPAFPFPNETGVTIPLDYTFGSPKRTPRITYCCKRQARAGHQRR